MAISLREPFFLRGRRSIVQRAVVMSLVLGGLALVASWLVYGTVLFVLTAGLPVWVGSVLGPTLGIASILLVYGPLSYWNRRPWWFIAFVLPIALAVASLTASAIIQLTIDPDDPGFFSLTAGLALTMGGVGCVLLRRSRAHVMAIVASILTAPAAALQFLLTQNYDFSSAPAGTVTAIQSLMLVSIYVTILGGVSIPWGIPFWWPPSMVQTDSTLQEPANFSEAG